MDRIIQTCRHERSSRRNRPMGKTENKGSILEAVEETKDKIPNAKSTKMWVLDCVIVLK